MMTQMKPESADRANLCLYMIDSELDASNICFVLSALTGIEAWNPNQRSIAIQSNLDLRTSPYTYF
jgi:hypothetical protein